MPVRVGLTIKGHRETSMEAQVRKYEEEGGEKGQIVFYGPSNFTHWEKEKWGNTPLREAVLGASGKPCCINRGFGGSCAEHHLYYYSRLVHPLEPKVLVYAPGFGNGSQFGYTVEETFELAQRVMLYAKSDFPDLRIYLLGLGGHYEGHADAKRLNGLLRGFAEVNPCCTFVNTSTKELNDPDAYLPDYIHFNNEGYRRYAEFFKEVLKDELAEF